MGNSNDYLGTASGIEPPLAAVSSVMGLPNATEMNGTEYLPMNISALGQYVDINDDTSVTHNDEQSNLIWTTLITAVQALADKMSALYWDKVDNKLYILTYDTVNSLAQFAWLSTSAGAVNLLGSTFASTIIDAAPDFAQMSMTRAVQGTGNFLVSITSATGLGSFEIPPAGGSVESTVSNILVGNVEPKLSAPYKIDDNLYIGNVRGGTAARFNFMDMVTDRGQVTKVPFFLNGGSQLGGNVAGTELPFQTHVREWGDDVALLYTVTGANNRACPALFDKADFHRMVIEIAIANGLRVV